MTREWENRGLFFSQRNEMSRNVKFEDEILFMKSFEDEITRQALKSNRW